MAILKKSLLVLIVVIFCVFNSTSISAYTITNISSNAEVLFPQDGAIFWVQKPQEQFNLTASGKGFINYTVTTDNNPLSLYEKSWMYLDNYVFYVSDPITFPANSTTTRSWNVSQMFITGLIGVGQHSATAKLSLTDLLSNPIHTKPDTHNFQVKVVPEPTSFILFVSGGAMLAVWRYWKKSARGYL